MKKRDILAMICMLSMASAVFANGKSEQQSASESGAEWKPDHNITIRVPNSAGGTMDTLSRIFAQGVQKEMDVPTVVKNVTGAAGALCLNDLNKSDPSISEMMASGIAFFTLTPLVNKDVKVSLDDYDPIASLVSEDFVLYVAPKDTGIENWDDFLAYAKKNGITAGCNAPGGATHMLFSALLGDAGIKWNAVSTAGSNKDLLNLVSGNVDCVIATVSVGSQFVEGGMVKPIACFSDAPFTGFDNYTVPTVSSKGYNIVFKSNNFIMVRKGVPQDHIDAVYNAYMDYQKTDEFKALAQKANFTPNTMNGAEIRKSVNDEKDFCQTYYKKYY
ncbi:MAG: tripartite tricarboxylate transporter substrate binding protein [Spirochaetia bacterium]|nr:tripartite tricarboxylate transporter substrate binding protein [Spirochaetia bacterium]